MGASQSTSNLPHASSNLSFSLPTLASYFVPPPPVLVLHAHPGYTSADTDAIAALLASKGLPRELVQAILDLVGVWAVCRVENRQALSVAASGLTPRGVRGTDWATGQEGELKDERAVGADRNGALVDAPGKVWYLVSPPVGCRGPTEDEEGEDEGGGGGDGDRGRERADWADEYRAGRDDSWADEFVRRDTQNDTGRVHARGERDDGRRDRHIGTSASSTSAAPTTATTAAAPKHWVRRIVVETFSCDQGWSDNLAAYGTYNQSYSWMELTLLRDGREVPASRCSIQYNVVAGQYHKAHTILLDSAHPLVRAARDGDRVVLWVRAMYPGWINHMRRASITVYTAPWAPASVAGTLG